MCGQSTYTPQLVSSPLRRASSFIIAEHSHPAITSRKQQLPNEGVDEQATQHIFGVALYFLCLFMRVVMLLLCFFVAVQGQFLKHNTWKIRSNKQRKEIDLKGIFGKERGPALVFEGSNLLTIILLHPSSYQFQHIAHLSSNIIININFGELNPQNYGRVDGLFNISVSSGEEHWEGMRQMSIYFGRKAVIRLRGCVLEVSTEGAAYMRMILLSICLAGITILLLTVLVKRKRWSQVEPWFLMAILGCQAKKLLILWSECSYFFPNGDNCTCIIIMKYLLIILSIKSVKIVAEVVRISNSVVKDVKRTAVMVMITMITVIVAPMGILHLLLPLCFWLQFRKYSRYSRLDFEVHYSLINLNLCLCFQLVTRLLSYSSSISLLATLLIVYTIACAIVATVMGQLYQYSPENNRSSPCINVDFDNKRFCPHCEEELFYEEENHDGSKSKQRHDLAYELWKFGVADCGHIFHCHCLLQVLRLQQGCPLIHHPFQATHETSHFGLNQNSKFA